MKKIIIIFAIVICMTACYAPATPIIGGDTPFIVTGIERYNDSLSVYRGYVLSEASTNSELGPFTFGTDPAIILPTGSYNINDTIKPFK